MDYSISTETVINILLVALAIAVINLIALWHVFEKANVAGWWVLVPYANLWKYVTITGYPGLYMFILLIPFVGTIFSIILSLRLAERFGKSSMFGFFGLYLFSVVGLLILAFDDSTYEPLEELSATNSSPTQ